MTTIQPTTGDCIVILNGEKHLYSQDYLAWISMIYKINMAIRAVIIVIAVLILRWIAKKIKRIRNPKF
jgi:hypothetical protein